MANRWSTGYVLLPGTIYTPGPRWHRPHPQRPLATVCDRVCAGRPVRREPPPAGDFPRCHRCEARVSSAKRREKRARVRQQEAAIKAKGRVEDVDAYERGKAAGVSVRAARAGLPGLGRRR